MSDGDGPQEREPAGTADDHQLRISLPGRRGGRRLDLTSRLGRRHGGGRVFP